MVGDYYYGTGRRKSAVARVFLKPGKGQFVEATAAEGVIQAAQTQWFLQGGDLDLATSMSESLAVLERAIGSDPRV